MKINNKGFTLIELLAAIVILSVIVAIMVPSVNYLIEKNKNDNYENLKKSIISAAKVYISDNRYNITLDYDDYDGLCNSGEDTTENIASINGAVLTESKLPIQWLVDNKLLSTNSKIINPKDKSSKLILSDDTDPDFSIPNKWSYVLVEYQCSTKDYTYKIEEELKGDSDDSLKWNE